MIQIGVVYHSYEFMNPFSFLVDRCIARILDATHLTTKPHSLVLLMKIGNELLLVVRLLYMMGGGGQIFVYV